MLVDAISDVVEDQDFSYRDRKVNELKDYSQTFVQNNHQIMEEECEDDQNHNNYLTHYINWLMNDNKNTFSNFVVNFHMFFRLFLVKLFHLHLT